MVCPHNPQSALSHAADGLSLNRPSHQAEWRRDLKEEVIECSGFTYAAFVPAVEYIALSYLQIPCDMLRYVTKKVGPIACIRPLCKHVRSGIQL